MFQFEQRCCNNIIGTVFAPDIHRICLKHGSNIQKMNDTTVEFTQAPLMASVQF